MRFYFSKSVIFLIVLCLAAQILLIFFTAKAVFAQEPQFLFKWGSLGSGVNQFISPIGIAVDSLGNLYVADSGNNRIQKFTNTGTSIAQWGSTCRLSDRFGCIDPDGNGPLAVGDGQFYGPHSIAVDSLGNIYVTELFNRRVQKFSREGVFITKWGMQGTGDGQFNSPRGIATDHLGNIYIVDGGNHRIQKFDSNGKFTTKWGILGSSDGQFSFPLDITADSVGYVYVADANNNRIQKFTNSGIFIAKWGALGSGNGQLNFPKGIASDIFNNIYVTNTNNHRIEEFTDAGTFITKWGSLCQISSGLGCVDLDGDGPLVFGDGQFVFPIGIATDLLGNIFVVDFGNNRVQVFKAQQPQQSPAFSNIGQFKSDGAIVIPESGTTTESTVVFKATVSDPNNDDVKLQVELKEFGQSFTETNLIESPLVSSGNETSVTRYGLIPQSYHWRVRVVDSQGNASDWKEFGIDGNVDFVVDLPLSSRAAMLAKELVSQPYLWGGKGWDYNQKLFVTIDAIKTGYRYYNPDIKSTDTGIGVDCSGLIMWAYNRSFDPLKPRFNNFVKNEGADAQYNYNTTVTTESELKLGDVMFFDWDINGYTDHVAMYVGEGGGYDVISAADTDRGIISASKDILKQLHGFRGFKRVISAIPPSVLISAHSPVDLMVTDPDGFVITPSTVIPSDAEYLREIPRALYYSEMEQGADGKPIDQVYSYTLKTGDYIIQVLPEFSASSTATYTLDFLAGDQSLILAKDALISQIPAQGYGVARSSAGEIGSFVPVLVDIKPDGYPNSINIGSKGVVPVAILSGPSFDAEDIVINSAVFAGAKPLRGSFKDIDSDGDLDLILHFDAQSLKLAQDSTRATLTGQLTDGRLIKGSDSVRIITNKTSFIKNMLTSLWLIISKTNIF